MSFLTTFEITISQLGIREDVGLWLCRKPTSPPLESNVNICHSERSEESKNHSRSVLSS